MSVFTLEQAIINYQTAIAILRDNSSPTEAQILNILIARDRLQTSLTETTLIPDNILTTLQELDNTLKKKQAAIAPIIAKLRPNFNPDTKTWWWLLEASKPDSEWEKWDWLCKGLSISFLTISLGLVGEISSRFLSGGPDTLGAILVSVQGVLTLLTAGGALTKTEQEAGKLFFRKINLPEQSWQEIGVGLSWLLMLGLFGVRLELLPVLATKYSNWGWHQYRKGDLSSAEEDYQRALSLNPDNEEAHFRLGLLYEDLQNFDSARTEYRLAMQGGNQPAINNLALPASWCKMFVYVTNP
jgi:tetratricopeptide (TPR) repeat protein